MKRLQWIVIAALLLVSLVAVPSGAATLTGRVTMPNGSGVYPIDIDVVDSNTRTAVAITGDTTDASGNYSFTIAPGRYDVAFIPAAGSQLFSHDVKSLNVAGTTTLNVSLLRGKYVTARVTRASGQGVALVDLDFRSPLTGDAADNVEGDLTDSTGFVTALVDSGLWDISVIPPLAERLVPIKIPGVATTANVPLGTRVLQSGHLVQGTVTDLGFFPLIDMDLDARPAGGGTKLFTPQDDTAADGTYGFVLPPGIYDLTAGPANNEPYAPATARAIQVTADVMVPNLALPPGHLFTVTCRAPGGAAVLGVDLDVDSLPALGRLEVSSDQSDGSGFIGTRISAGPKRITMTPPVSSKLLPIRIEPQQVTGPVALGNLTFPAGKWVSGTVTAAATGWPLALANLDFVSIPSGLPAITIGDVTDAAGFFRVVLPPGSYRLRVNPPSASYDTLVVEPVAFNQDTVLALSLVNGTVDVPTLRSNDPFQLHPSPNPMLGALQIAFRASGPVDLSVIDASGRRMATLFRGNATGVATVSWNGRGQHGRQVAPGIYFLQLSDGRMKTTRRFVKLQ